MRAHAACGDLYGERSARHCRRTPQIKLGCCDVVPCTRSYCSFAQQAFVSQPLYPTSSLHHLGRCSSGLTRSTVGKKSGVGRVRGSLQWWIGLVFLVRYASSGG